MGAALLLAGFGFKIAIFPFSLWVPDTYQAAPAPILAFLSVAPKAAAVVALFRLVFELFLPAGLPVTAWLSILAGLTMTIGNLLALRQRDLKRLLAFSGIAQIGYVLLALSAGTTLAAGLALFYFVAYLVANAGAFLVVTAMETAGCEPTIDGARHMVRRSPLACIGDAGLSALPRRHPVRAGVLGKDVRLPDGGSGGPLRSRLPGGRARGRGPLLLPDRRGIDVHRRRGPARPSRSPVPS